MSRYVPSSDMVRQHALSATFYHACRASPGRAARCRGLSRSVEARPPNPTKGEEVVARSSVIPPKSAMCKHMIMLRFQRALDSFTLSFS
jgi:hypothetical protein